MEFLVCLGILFAFIFLFACGILSRGLPEPKSKLTQKDRHNGFMKEEEENREISTLIKERHDRFMKEVEEHNNEIAAPEANLHKPLGSFIHTFNEIRKNDEEKLRETMNEINQQSGL